MLVFLVLPAIMAASIKAHGPTPQVPLCSALGLLSYPLYLVHLPILAYGASHGWLMSGSGQAGTVALILVVAVAATWLFDVPARAWIARQFKARTGFAVRPR